MKASPATISSCIDISRFHVATSGDAEADIDFVAKLLDQDGKIIDAKEFEGSAPPAGSDAKAYVERIQ